MYLIHEFKFLKKINDIIPLNKNIYFGFDLIELSYHLACPNGKFIIVFINLICYLISSFSGPFWSNNGNYGTRTCFEFIIVHQWSSFGI